MTRQVMDGKTAPNEKTDLGQAMRQLVRSGKVRIPPFPGIATRLQALVSSQNYGLKDLARLVASDETLTADTLRYANSALNGAGVEVTSVDTAIRRLGAQQAVRLAMTSALGRGLVQSGPLALLRARLWRQAITAAIVGQNLGARRGIDEGEAFTCNLLHDFGKVAAIACLEQLLKADARQSMQLDLWASLIERYHIPLGELLAREWKLSSAITETMRSHHSPAQAREHVSLITLVALVDQICAVLESESYVSGPTLARLSGLSDEEVLLLERLLPKVPPLVASFGATSTPANSSAQKAGAASSSARDSSEPSLRTALVVEHGGRVQQCLSRSGTPRTLSWCARAPLAEEALALVRFPDHSDLELWVTITRCQGTGDLFEVEGTIFAGARAMVERWGQLLAPVSSATSIAGAAPAPHIGAGHGTGHATGAKVPLAARGSAHGVIR